LDKLKENLPYYTLIFTGETKNETNGGFDHHWLGLVDNNIFDSYGMRTNPYKLPEFINRSKNPQLQEYNSDICGHYVLLLFNHVYLNNEKSEDEPLSWEDQIRTFMEKYNLSAQHKRENDRTILKAFNAIVKNRGRVADKRDDEQDVGSAKTD
jgi:hypothetical protein